MGKEKDTWERAEVQLSHSRCYRFSQSNGGAESIQFPFSDLAWSGYLSESEKWRSLNVQRYSRVSWESNSCSYQNCLVLWKKGHWLLSSGESLKLLFLGGQHGPLNSHYNFYNDVIQTVGFFIILRRSAGLVEKRNIEEVYNKILDLCHLRISFSNIWTSFCPSSFLQHLEKRIKV